VKFRERAGIEKPKTFIQLKDMSDDLRTSLWNVLDMLIWTCYGFHDGGAFQSSTYMSNFTESLWFEFYKKRLDARPEYRFQIVEFMRSEFFVCAWYEAYEFVEFVISYEDDPELTKGVNYVLERELSGYRVINGQFVPVSDEVEKEAIEKALEPGPYEGARAHLSQALKHFSNRESPDYRNSIKESISAVESLACELAQKKNAALGDALAVLEKEGQLHGALKKGFAAIYGYTSNADGIRHGMLEESNLDADDAKFFLVSCAAFINYLKAKHAKAT
jgi:hypothetical protein